MKRALHIGGLLLAAALLVVAGACLYDLTAAPAARPPGPAAAPPPAPRPVVRPALLVHPHPTSSAPVIHAA
ncbi:hypothetical protein GCM10027048_35670 [Hymenobacter coalescens]